MDRPEARILLFSEAMSWESIALLGPPLAALIGSITIAAWRYNALPSWIGYTGAPLALMMLIAPVSYVDILFWMGFVIFWPWLLAVAVYTVVRPQLPAVPNAAS